MPQCRGINGLGLTEPTGDEDHAYAVEIHGRGWAQLNEEGFGGVLLSRSDSPFS